MNSGRKTQIALNLWAGGLLLIVALSAYATARYRPLWHDEVYTAAVSRLGSPGKIWGALAQAVETNPPLYYMIEASARKLPVSEELGLRLPSLVGFLVFIGSVAFFVRRAFGPLSGLLAVAVLASSEALYYGSEARPYGLLLGAFGLAAILWQHRKRGSASPATVVFFALCLAVACSLHYYAVFGLMMFGLAEVLAEIRVRKFDWPVLLAFPLALVPLFIALPLVRAAKSAFGGAFWAHSSLKSILAGYSFVFSSPQFGAINLARLASGRAITLGDLFLPIVLIVAVCGIIGHRRKSPERLNWPRPELLLAFAFLLLPLVTGLVCMATTGIFTPRYALASTMGVAVFSAWLIPAWNRIAAYAFGAVLTLALICNEVPATFHRLSALAAGETPASSVNQGLIPVFRMMDAGATLVIADGHLYLQSLHYAVPQYRSSLLYLEDRELAVRFSGNDTIDAGFLKLQPYENIPLRHAPDFLEANRQFVLLSTGNPREWLPAYLRQRNAQIQAIETIGASDLTGTSTLYRVQLP